MERPLAQLALPKLVAGIVRHCLEPAKQVQDDVGTLLTQFDSHIGGSGGPSGFDWEALLGLRQDLASIYLNQQRLVHLLSDLAMLATYELAPRVNEQIDRAVHLMSHRYRNHQPLVDFGDFPQAQADVPELALFVAYLLDLHADANVDFAPTISTRKEEDRIAVTIRRLAVGDALSDIVARKWVSVPISVQRDNELSVVRLEFE